MSPGATQYEWWNNDGVRGICCYCGYGGEKETECDISPDHVHCVHWWDGAENDNTAGDG